MSDYEYKTDYQNNMGFTETLNMTVKSPAISKRIFEKYDKAVEYIRNITDSAIPGLILTVIRDGPRNGAYIVEEQLKSDGTFDKLILTPLPRNGGGTYELPPIKNGLRINRDDLTLNVAFDDKEIVSNSIDKKTDNYAYFRVPAPLPPNPTEAERQAWENEENKYGIKLNIDSIDKTNENRRFLLDSYDTKQYIDNCDCGTY